MDIDRTNWSGDGEFTERLLAVLQDVPEVSALRVEDAPASRSDTGYLFLSNEIYVAFAERIDREPVRWFGVVARTRDVRRPVLTMAQLEQRLSALEDIGAPDYSDEGMMQYLRAQRIIPPYQTRGYKLVELVRIYEAGRGVLPHGASGSS